MIVSCDIDDCSGLYQWRFDNNIHQMRLYGYSAVYAFLAFGLTKVSSIIQKKAVHLNQQFHVHIKVERM